MTAVTICDMFTFAMNEDVSSKNQFCDHYVVEHKLALPKIILSRVWWYS
jgi:hypothetical protein